MFWKIGFKHFWRFPLSAVSKDIVTVRPVFYTRIMSYGRTSYSLQKEIRRPCYWRLFLSFPNRVPFSLCARTLHDACRSIGNWKWNCKNIRQLQITDHGDAIVARLHSSVFFHSMVEHNTAIMRRNKAPHHALKHYEVIPVKVEIVAFNLSIFPACG